MKISGFWLAGLILSWFSAFHLVGWAIFGQLRPTNSFLLGSIAFGVLAVACFLADLGLRSHGSESK